MDKSLLEQTVGTIVSNYPQLIPHLSGDVFAVLFKHYPGGQDHDQQNHAGDGGGDGEDGGESMPDSITENMGTLRAFDKFKDLKDPRVELTEKYSDGFQFGGITINTENSDERIGKTFVHEYGHYADYKLDITAEAEYNAMYDSLLFRDYAIGQNENESINWAINAIHKGADGYSAHSEDYFRNIANADRKEFFAIALSAYVYYDPKFFKTFPEAKEYFRKLENGDPAKSIKTVDYFAATLSRMVSNTYTGNMGGEFVDILGALVRGQMQDAYRRAYAEAGFSDALPDWLQADLEAMQQEQANFDYIYAYYQAIIDARVDGSPLQPLLDRVSMWVARWKEAHAAAVLAITRQLGGRLMWVEGDTQEKCDTCLRLNGIVAYASEWEALGVHPQGGPNDLLNCGGWNCQCELKPVERRRSPRAFETIMNIIGT